MASRGTRPSSRLSTNTLLWPEKPQSAARHSLNEAVRVIRRSIGEATLETDTHQIRLVSETIRLDVEELEAQAAESHWCAAAGLVSGEFLEGFAVPDASAFEDWLTAERTLWRGRSVEVLARCAEERLAAGDDPLLDHPR